jgi:phosphoribosylaminoimidazole-succinocarboxamide synthase
MDLEIIKEQLDRGLDRFELPCPVYRGKVRDCFSLGKNRLIVTTDRVSAFDRVFPETIPFKGQVLNQLSAYFLRQAEAIVPSHLIEVLDPNVSLVREAKPFPIEVIVRGYLAGSAWRDYQAGLFEGNYGFALPPNLSQNGKLPEAVITPTTKSDGHDSPIGHEEAAKIVGEETWREIVRVSIALFQQGSMLANHRGLVLVDTKYEFGLIGEKLFLIDEVHTPDSSRYWYQGSERQLSKEFLREWLLERGFRGEGEPPALDDPIRIELSERYLELYQVLTGEELLPTFGEDATARIRRRIRESGCLQGMVSILMGSPSDRDIAEKVARTLDSYEVEHSLEIASAHKVPEKVLRIVGSYNESLRPVVHITIAGRSNGLSGVTAANSIHPVIALPAFKDSSDYLVNIHSSLQMPSDTPVLTVVDPQNAAMAAIRILANSDERLRKKLFARLEAIKEKFEDRKDG